MRIALLMLILVLRWLLVLLVLLRLLLRRREFLQVIGGHVATLASKFSHPPALSLAEHVEHVALAEAQVGGLHCSEVVRGHGLAERHRAGTGGRGNKL
jgi:hypothetical protein